jgi:hypothetical protein
MYLVRDIMYCKPGMVRPLVEKFKAMAVLNKKMGMPSMKIMTDVSAEQYWTLVSEMEVESLAAFEKMMADMQGASPDDTKQFQEIMKDYHDLVTRGRREIYKLES